MDLQGTYTALITPFDEEGNIDYKGLRELVKYQLEAGVNGVLALGTTAETPTLETKEQEKILYLILNTVKDEVQVMVGTGTNCTRTTIENTLYAEKIGADMALVVSPYYNQPTQEGLYQHFQAVHDNTNIPLVVYNIAGRTGINIETPTLGRIAQLERIIGVKEASGKLEQIEEVINRIAKERENFSVMSGDDSLTDSVMKNGGNGVISVISNLFPSKVVEMVNFGLNGDYIEMSDLCEDLSDLSHAAFIETNPAPIKYLMQRVGLPAGGCRLPLVGLREESKQKINKLVLDKSFI